MGKNPKGLKKKWSLEKAIRLHLALRGGVAPPHTPFAPAYRPVIGSIIIKGIIVVILREGERERKNREKGGKTAKKTELRKKNRQKKHGRVKKTDLTKKKSANKARKKIQFGEN